MDGRELECAMMFFAEHIWGQVIGILCSKKGKLAQFCELSISATAPFVFTFTPGYCKSHIMSHICSTAFDTLQALQDSPKTVLTHICAVCLVKQRGTHWPDTGKQEMLSTWCKVVIKAQLEILTQKRQTTLLKQN